MDSVVSRSPIPVLMDHREARGGVARALAASPAFRCQTVCLQAGDYLVDGRFLFGVCHRRRWPRWRSWTVPTSAGDIECARRNVSLDCLERLASAFGMVVPELLREPDPTELGAQLLRTISSEIVREKD